ncbi:MAG: TetR/AcrR family transcriptional regulator [Firmicutes bacterium]|nr:TetR/AcrR family transcriptional regulator [Bacillota bacterium]
MGSPILPPAKDPQLVLQRREQIVRAATALFIQKGYHGTTTREIARASGLGTGTLYEYVTSKEDILYLVCDMIHTELEARLDQVPTPGETAANQMPRLLEGFLRVIDELQDIILLMYQETQSLPRGHMHYVLRREEAITERFATLIRRGIEDHSFTLSPSSVTLMAHNITVLGQMWAFRRWSLRHTYPLTAFIETQTSLIMRELCARDEGMIATSAQTPEGGSIS